MYLAESVTESFNCKGDTGRLTAAEPCMHTWIKGNA